MDDQADPEPIARIMCFMDDDHLNDTHEVVVHLTKMPNAPA
jgi:hypothetical protein